MPAGMVRPRASRVPQALRNAGVTTLTGVWLVASQTRRRPVAVQVTTAYRLAGPDAPMAAITDPTWPGWPRCASCDWPIHPAVGSHADCCPTSSHREDT